jgi:hypothetical protein
MITPTLVRVQLTNLQAIFQDLIGTSQSSVARQRDVASTPLLANSSTSSRSTGITFVTNSPADTSSPTLQASLEGSDTSASTLNFENAYIYVYDSDRTDFLATSSTPCPVKTRVKSRHQTGTTSRFFEKTRAKKNTLPLQRKLDFGTTSGASKRRPCRKLNTMGIIAPEYSPSHRWTDAERE